MIPGDLADIRLWSVRTIGFTLVCSGVCEVFEDDIDRILDPIYSSFNPEFYFDDFARAVVDRAVELIEVKPGVVDRSFCPVSQVSGVMRWVVDTMSVVNQVKGRSLDNETLEADADLRVVSDVQGGRSELPCKGELDLIVLRSLEYARGMLAA